MRWPSSRCPRSPTRRVPSRAAADPSALSSPPTILRDRRPLKRWTSALRGAEEFTKPPAFAAAGLYCAASRPDVTRRNAAEARGRTAGQSACQSVAGTIHCVGAVTFLWRRGDAVSAGRPRTCTRRPACTGAASVIASVAFLAGAVHDAVSTSRSARTIGHAKTAEAPRPGQAVTSLVASTVSIATSRNDLRLYGVGRTKDSAHKKAINVAPALRVHQRAHVGRLHASLFIPQ